VSRCILLLISEKVWRLIQKAVLLLVIFIVAPHWLLMMSTIDCSIQLLYLGICFLLLLILLELVQVDHNIFNWILWALVLFLYTTSIQVDWVPFLSTSPPILDSLIHLSRSIFYIAPSCLCFKWSGEQVLLHSIITLELIE
jgi:hypothetical protein